MKNVEKFLKKIEVFILVSPLNGVMACFISYFIFNFFSVLLTIPLISKLPFMPSKQRLKSSLKYLKDKVQPDYGAYKV
jgi:hypothetical protein